MRSPAESRHEDFAWGTVAYPAPVLLASTTDAELIEPAAELAWSDDAYWWRFVHRPFSWSRFLTWWIARRWVVPRDIRKE